MNFDVNNKKNKDFSPVIIPLTNMEKANLSFYWELNMGKEYALVEINSKKQFDGLYFAYGKDGNMVESGKYKNNKKIGTWQTYNPETRKLAESIEYVDGKRHGKYVLFDDKGKPAVEGNFKNDEKDGEWNEYSLEYLGFRQRKVKIITVNYENGKKDGYYNELIGGKLVVKGQYQNDKKINTWIEYDWQTGKVTARSVYYGDKENNVLIEKFYENGNLKKSYKLVNGKLDGVELINYPNGNTHFLTHYKKGEMHGARKTYYENGNEFCISTYSKGKPKGLHQTFYENGSLKYDRCYDGYNMPDKWHKEFKENGDLVRARLYNNGHLVFGETFRAQNSIRVQQFRNNIGSIFGVAKKKVVFPDLQQK